MPTEDVVFPGQGGDEVRALLVTPGEGGEDAGGIVLVHEVFGLDVPTREIAERFGAEGFTVLAPDLYSREGLPGPESTADDPAPTWEVEDIRKAATGLPDRRALADLDAGARYLAGREDVDARSIAVIGFCLGGTLAFLSGCTSTRFACVVEFYGRVLYPELSQAKPMQPIEMLLNLDRPMLAFFGEADASIGSDDVALLERHLSDANKDYEVVRYPGAQHSFFNHRRPRYDAEAAADAWKRTLTFLRERL